MALPARGEVDLRDRIRHDPDELNNLGATKVPPSLPKALAALQHCHSTTQCQAAARLG